MFLSKKFHRNETHGTQQLVENCWNDIPIIWQDKREEVSSILYYNPLIVFSTVCSTNKWHYYLKIVTAKENQLETLPDVPRILSRGNFSTKLLCTVSDPNKRSTARNEGVFRKLPSQLHSHLCSDRISFDFAKLQQLTMRSNRGDACFLPSPCKFFFLSFFSFFRPFSIFYSRTIIPVTRRSWRTFVDQKLLEFRLDTIQCLFREVR